MKRIMTLALLMLLMLALLCGCSMELQSEPVVESMLAALVQEDTEAAMALLHPILQKEEAAPAGVQDLVELFGERTVESKTLQGFHINQGINTGGKYRQETGTFLLTLDDGSAAQLEFVYLSDADGVGFINFYINFEAAGVQT